MKLTCKQQDLAKGLSVVGHAVSSRTTLPILSHILISAEGDMIRLSATNLEIGITCRVPAAVSEPGTTTVPAKLFTDLVNSLQPASLDLTMAEGTQSLKVSDKRSQATLRGMDPSEFPSIPAEDGTETPVMLNAAELSEMIAQTTFAAATDDARPVFTGVLARVADGELTLASADSFRLAVRSAPLPEGGTPGDVLIPARTLSDLARILPDEGSVRMVVTPNRNQVLFHADGVDLVSNLIAGQFPNFAAILPKGQVATRATLSTADFRQAAKQASLFARDSSNIVRLQVNAGEGDGLQPGQRHAQGHCRRSRRHDRGVACLGGRQRHRDHLQREVSDRRARRDRHRERRAGAELGAAAGCGQAGRRHRRLHLRDHADAQHALVSANVVDETDNHPLRSLLVSFSCGRLPVSSRSDRRETAHTT